MQRHKRGSWGGDVELGAAGSGSLLEALARRLVQRVQHAAGAAAQRRLAAALAAGMALGLAASHLLPLRSGALLRAAAAYLSTGLAHPPASALGGAGSSLLAHYAGVFADAANVTGGMPQLGAAWGAGGCSRGIYLDVGTNVGVHIRKLYHPERFPNASVLPIFDALFGAPPGRAGVCAAGFEPNPRHAPYLTTLNAWFARRGYPAHVFTDTAVGQAKGTLPFYGDRKAPPGVHEWAASLAYNETVQGTNVVVSQAAVVDLVEFFSKVVRPILDAEERATGKRPPVAMKLDIEGAEYAVLPGLILSGALCDVDVAFIEWHPNSFKPKGGLEVDREYMPGVVRLLQQAAPCCRTQLSDLDDESYADGPSIPLPE